MISTLELCNQELEAIKRHEIANDIDVDWEVHSIKWAESMIAIAEKNNTDVAWDVAGHACRRAREEPKPYPPFPRWFGPRLRRVIGPFDTNIMQFSWVDHSGIVKDYETGAKCFVSEPYNPLEGQHLHEAEFIAENTGCELVFHRVAWWHPRCFRVMFRPLDHTLNAKEAEQRYKLRPIYKLFPKRHHLFRR